MKNFSFTAIWFSFWAIIVINLPKYALMNIPDVGEKEITSYDQEWLGCYIFCHLFCGFLVDQIGGGRALVVNFLCNLLVLYFFSSAQDYTSFLFRAKFCIIPSTLTFPSLVLVAKKSKVFESVLLSLATLKAFSPLFLAPFFKFVFEFASLQHVCYGLMVVSLLNLVLWYDLFSGYWTRFFPRTGVLDLPHLIMAHRKTLGKRRTWLTLAFASFLRAVVDLDSFFAIIVGDSSSYVQYLVCGIGASVVVLGYVYLQIDEEKRSKMLYVCLLAGTGMGFFLRVPKEDQIGIEMFFLGLCVGLPYYVVPLIFVGHNESRYLANTCSIIEGASLTLKFFILHGVERAFVKYPLWYGAIVSSCVLNSIGCAYCGLGTTTQIGSVCAPSKPKGLLPSVFTQHIQKQKKKSFMEKMFGPAHPPPPQPPKRS